MSNDEGLQELYPFLHGRKADARALNAALVESVRQKAQHHQDVFGVFSPRMVRLWWTPPGRSPMSTAATGACPHGQWRLELRCRPVAVEFLHPITVGRPALTAIDLTCDSTMMTAIGNDVGFEHIFVRQIIAQGRPGDGLIGISTSGNSAG